MRLNELKVTLVVIDLLLIVPNTKCDNNVDGAEVFLQDRFSRSRSRRDVMSSMVDTMFGNFRNVTMQDVWTEIQSKKVVSYTIARDTTQFLAVQTMWVLAGLMLWKGPLVNKVDERTGEDVIDFMDDRFAAEAVDLNKINNFFTNPQTVTRNLVVCATLFLITASFWFLPSLLWKKSHLMGIIPIPGAPVILNRDDTEHDDAIDAVTVNLHNAEERVTGIYTALVDRGLGDIYNRVLCPTCIVQIIVINSMVFLGKLVFWGLTSSMPASLPFLEFIG